jgi:glycosyltransferase involved in cell wall biosynthesis
LFDKSFAKKVVFIPNIEWVLPIDEKSLVEHPVDLILLKNAHARQCMAATRLCIHLPKAHVVGWTSLDFRNEAALARPLERNFLHLAGTSRQKGTSLLLNTWLDAPFWPKLTVAQSLLPDPTAFQPHLDLTPNLALHLTTLHDTRRRRLQAEHGIHIYPSAAEGFGHALNEARALGRVLITTNAPPMRDLVDDGVTGSLIAIDPANIDQHHLASTYPVTRHALQAAIAGLLDREPASLHAMGRHARLAFLRDRATFHHDFARIWREIRS